MTDKHVQLPVSHVEVPSETTTTTENGTTDSETVKAEGPGAQGEGGVKCAWWRK